MTLVELLVVLTILALLTTMAITSSDVLLGQGRYETTARTLTNIQEAVLGPQNARQPDGTILVSGFVADMGRLPNTVGTDPKTQLAELWTIPNPSMPFAITPAAHDPEVLVATGWRGPYLRLPVGQSSLLDGWGNLLRINGSNAVGANVPITSVGSLGADLAPGGTGYDADVTVALANGCQMAFSGNVYILSNGQPTNPDSTQASQIVVMLYGPDGAGGIAETQLLPPDNIKIDNGVVSYSTNGISLTVGPRFLRAYLGTPATAKRKSTVVRVQHSDVVHLTIQ